MGLNKSIKGQMDRWHILTTLNYLSEKQEFDVVSSKLKSFKSAKNKKLLTDMIQLATLTREGFA
jgi:cobaltochelatase CobS